MLTTPRHKIAAAFGIAGSLCAVGLVVFGDTSDLRYVWGNELVVIILAGPSAWLAGLALAGVMGLQGGWGWLGAFFGYLAATALGAMIAGTFLLPAFGTLFAPLILLVNMFEHPLVGIAWFLAFVFLQKIAIEIRA